VVDVCEELVIHFLTFPARQKFTAPNVSQQSNDVAHGHIEGVSALEESDGFLDHACQSVCVCYCYQLTLSLQRAQGAALQRAPRHHLAQRLGLVSLRKTGMQAENGFQKEGRWSGLVTHRCSRAEPLVRCEEDSEKGSPKGDPVSSPQNRLSVLTMFQHRCAMRIL
jgi:hypothetical protein